MRRLLLAVILLSWLLGGREAAATPPTVYSAPTNESPVRADPDDLLLLPGYGFAATDRIVYVLLPNTTAALTHPAIGTVPGGATVVLGARTYNL